jgi:hypothetical protein
MDDIVNSLFMTSQILPSYEDKSLKLDTPGLSGPLLFDTLILPPVYSGSAHVNVTEFRVKCGTVSSATFSFGPGLTNWTVSAPISEDYSVHFVDGVPPVGYVPLPCRYSPSLA